MESHELIQAIKSGLGLKKKHLYDKTKPATEENICGTEFLFYDAEHKYFEGKGWASALGRPDERIKDIIDNPERWEVAGKIEEREWVKVSEYNK